ncbi:Gamma-aminobutyric acid receptor exp-1, partial [Trichinella britovi]
LQIFILNKLIHTSVRMIGPPLISFFLLFGITVSSATAQHILREGRWRKVIIAPEVGPEIRSRTYSDRFRSWWQRTLESYDNRLRPDFGVKPVEIRVGMKLISISSIDEASMRFTAEMFYHEYWRDLRLQFNRTWFGYKNPIDLPSEGAERLWIPDTCFNNALDSKGPEPGSLSHRGHMKLFEDGTIFYSRRLSITAQCKFDLLMYPFDQQACGLELSSYGHTTDDVKYEWTVNDHSIELDDISLPDFYAKSYRFYTRNETYAAGEFNVARMCVLLKRRSGFCFLNLFVPATAVVTSSWISLWMEDQTQFSDMFSIILAIIFLSFSFNAVMPKVSYIKVMDLYLGGCFIFAFLSLAKLIIVKLLHRQIKKRRKRSSVGNIMNSPTMNNGGDNSNDPNGRDPATLDLESLIRFSLFQPFLRRTTHDCFWKGAKIFHVGSQVILPVAFGTFGFFYFAIFSNVNMSNTTC